MNKKKRIALITVFCVLVLLVLNVGISFNPTDNMGCISVALDKLPMRFADRIVITVGTERYEITDPQLVREITDATLCATNAGLCGANTDRCIEVYCGGTVIRKMQWETSHNGITVYSPGPLHWIITSASADGQVFPSDELIAKLEAIIGL